MIFLRIMPTTSKKKVEDKFGNRILFFKTELQLIEAQS